MPQLPELVKFTHEQSMQPSLKSHWLANSHCSPDTLIPSPQFGWQLSVIKSQYCPDGHGFPTPHPVSAPVPPMNHRFSGAMQGGQQASSHADWLAYIPLEQFVVLTGVELQL